LKKEKFRFANRLLTKAGYQLVRNEQMMDYCLHEYDSYQQYKEVQVFHNRRKIRNVWADPTTLDLVADIVRSNVGKDAVRGLCHGTRNGFEQNYLADNHAGFEVIGTDIADSAADYPRSVVWDFHDDRPEWTSHFDFVYSNSLDQSWKPKLALTTWLNQIHKDGVVIIEHTHEHGPMGASEMDPFGVRPTVMPYVLADWFGHQVSVSFRQSVKAGTGIPVWLFVIRKNVEQVTS
jgi:hypothetical protein